MALTRLKIRIAKCKLNQWELARKVGVSDSSICRIANGLRTPDESLKKKIAKALSARVTYLWPLKGGEKGGGL